MGRYDDYYGYKPYVPVAQRRAQAAREIARRAKKGLKVEPVRIEGRAITSTFWGDAWCQNLEGYSDFENRLPRGRTYARNGSVVHLSIARGQIKAIVSGSELYEVQIDIAALPKPAWEALKKQCAGKVGTLVELLQGKLSKSVMELVTDRDRGLFPKPKEIKMRCSCPDYAGMCKHVAAVMYGVGNRLDSSPEMLFVLRGLDHKELIEQAIPAAPIQAANTAPTIAAADLGAVFDIEIDEAPATAATAATAQAPKKPAPKKAAKKAPATKPKEARPASREKPAAKKAPATKPKEARPASSEKPAAKKASTVKPKEARSTKTKKKAVENAATTAPKNARSASRKK